MRHGGLGVQSIMVVTYHDVINTFNNPQPVEYFRSLSSLPFLFGVSMYCFEGFGMILPIEASMQHREKFPMVLSSSIGVITALFLSFSLMGYNAYGNHTEDIITLNLPHVRPSSHPGWQPR
jgi:amino acid permease